MPCQFRVRSRSSAAFTLVEVLISIAIALLLIVGISQIFGIAQRTTSMGTALLGTAASDRSLQSTLNRDFHSIIPIANNPGLVIASYAAAAFRNQPDFDAATNPVDPTNFGPAFTTPNSPYSQAFSTNYRIHRVDRMCFFARDLYYRQTADAPNLTSATTSNEAFIWYGHLTLPNNPAIQNWNPTNPGAASGQSANWFNPGVLSTTTGSPANDNNQFASSWILGRQVILLLPTPTGAPLESGFMPNPAGGRPYPLLLDPTNGKSALCVDGTGTNASLYASRYDVCYTSVANWYSLISSLLLNPPRALSPWWQQLSGLQTGTSRTGDFTIDQRYYANPFPTKNASFTGSEAIWNSAAAAQTSPIFIRGCSQFIVEFAGDYATQNPIDGTFQSAGPDGQIDFIVDPNDTNVPKRRRIRWYGFPRDVATTLAPGGTQPDGTLDINDVMPVSSYLGTAPLAFEHTIPTGTATPRTTPVTALPLLPAAGGVPMHSPAYVCSWGADGTSAFKPKMIRITVAIDDANGRLNGEQTYEYVFTLP